MKEITAYIRRDDVDEVIERLQRAGAPGVSVIEIHPVAMGMKPTRSSRTGLAWSTDTGTSPSSSCTDDQAETLIRVVENSCCTGNPGDGMEFVSEVVDAVRIRDGARGEAALCVSRCTEGVRTAS